MIVSPSTRLEKAAEMVGGKTLPNDNHIWVHLCQFGVSVCAGCGVSRDISTSPKCSPISPRPDIEAMKTIGRKHHG